MEQKEKFRKILQNTSTKSGYVLHNSKNYTRRYSGEKYINPPEKIQQIKEKYKNGVSIDVINEML